jgi:ABC-type nickel/cobalt efflux system permease component RcnA
MAVLGLVVLLLVAVVAVAAIVGGGEPATLDLAGVEIGTTVTGVFLTGAGAVLLAMIGLWLTVKGLKRGRARRAEVRSLRDRARAAEHSGPRPQETGRPPTQANRAASADDHFNTAPRDDLP